MNTHFAITIGPIGQTLKNTRATKAMWSASYMFSWIMREFYEQLQNIPNKSFEILNLDYNAEHLKPGKGVGLHPDRLIARGKAPDIQAIAGNILQALSNKISGDLSNPKIQNKRKAAQLQTASAGKVEAMLRKYLRLLFIELELEAAELSDPVAAMDAYLNSMELEACFPAQVEQDFLSIFFEELFFNDFIRREFGDPGFESTVEIATAAFGKFEKTQSAYEREVRILRSFNPEIDDSAFKQEEFVAATNKLAGSHFKLCHKYIAVVQADGDKMGPLFKSLSEVKQRELTRKLADFSIEASQRIRDYGGTPVYAGGDDLLFFAPVSVMGDLLFPPDHYGIKDVFELLDSLRSLFIRKLTEVDGITEAFLSNNETSMSFGVSISHYKYPLGESLAIAQQNLFGKIKGADKRNSIAWTITKHSGANFGALLSQKKDQNPFTTAFKDILNSRLPAKLLAQTDVFLASIIFKLESLEGLFQATASSAKREDHFYNIVFNNFNESLHRDEKNSNKLSEYLQKVLALINAAFVEAPVTDTLEEKEKKQKIRENLDRIYAALRYIHFLYTNDKD